MKNNDKLLILALLSMVILSFTYFLFKPSHERIEIIGKDNLNFELQKILPIKNFVGQAYVYSEKSNLAIDNIPEDMMVICNNRESFTIDIENKDGGIARNIHFLIENAENLRFEYPKEFIIPPLSTKKITLFVDVDCPNAPKSINPIFKIEGTNLAFKLNINIENRSE